MNRIHHFYERRLRDNAGYVTLEGALVIAALVIVTVFLVSGFLLITAHAAAVTTARQAARAASLGAGPQEVSSLVARNHPEARVQVREEKREDLPSDLLHIQLTYPAPSFFSDIEVRLVTVKEPDSEFSVG